MMTDWHGFILTSGDMRNSTYRVYKTPDTALRAANNHADNRLAPAVKALTLPWFQPRECQNGDDS